MKTLLALALSIILAGCATAPPKDGPRIGAIIAGVIAGAALLASSSGDSGSDAPAGPQCHFVISGGPNGSTTSTQVCH